MLDISFDSPTFGRQLTHFGQTRISYVLSSLFSRTSQLIRETFPQFFQHLEDLPEIEEGDFNEEFEENNVDFDTPIAVEFDPSGNIWIENEEIELEELELGLDDNNNVHWIVHQGAFLFHDGRNQVLGERATVFWVAAVDDEEDFE